MNNYNVVQKWAENMRDYADNAMNQLEGCGYQSATDAMKYLGQIKGCAEAIIAAVEHEGGEGG